MRSLMKAWPVLLCTGMPPALLDDIDGIPGQARVVNDLFARLVGQKRRGQQADDVVALDEIAGFVEEEAAVEVAIPGDAHVGAVRDDRLAVAARFSGSSGLGMPFGKVPSGS